ncbi:hypothetical protein G4Y79_13660 [Phototrophicus methaneseepsis]|uniref:Glycosyltransferase RgtA/B/C/D-like domain-containing protein n=2 Tax=Phototrophicus methaneseepsis TaxID=2710758 RepID=A0A7S8E5J5_9CHLR|nr:hypothetical protein G4Y79_13660 [Phototrophicus methaneseepsis]
MKRTIYRILMAAATLLLLAAFAIYVAYAINIIQFPYDYDQGEGFELVDTILYSQFQWPYQNTDDYPFYSSNYPPVFHILPVPFVWLFGPSYAYGRLLSFIGTLITAALIAYAINREGQRPWVAILCALAFLSSNMIYHNGPLFRQHMTMVLFETASVVLLTWAYPAHKWRYIALAFGFLILAGYTKQLAAITAIAVLMWLFLRSPRQAILWGIRFAVVGFAIFIGLTLATQGEWWRQAIVANVNHFDPIQALGLVKLWFQLHGALLIPAGLLVLYELYIDRLSLYSIWFVATTIFGVIGAGTWGAGDSYYATSITAMCILTGILFSRTLNHGWQFPDNFYVRALSPTLGPVARQLASTAFVIIPVAFIAYAISTFKMPTEGPIFGDVAAQLHIQPNVLGRHYDSASYDVLGYANIGHFTTAEDMEAGKQIVEIIQGTDGLVMSEDAGFELAAGRPVISNPTQLRNLYLNGEWNGTTLINMVENQEFALIILRASFYPDPMLQVVLERYTPQESISLNGFTYVFWRPAGEASTSEQTE